ncbi:hypothetical protein HYDPIDRAFT_113150 [Hydnomerulius pinastri MD-312]|uniref:Zn(2)-C6 fungal-type domain-containing protein n=1 Tax=Hydnomerulius pinastri MD-312 TaxID=994086 RepID=A0A0C9VZ36_9AGAM|nr:hypothetical protein HYDPIDRAFT_113150 [Hydnomerulius pinastri MD-312]
MSTGSIKERKRTRGEIACAECRRLKARCDKRVPCSTCVKRGCGMLCPNGTMPPGEGSRFVGVAEDFLRQRMAKMEERMRSLEDALAIVQCSGSSEVHPLLAKKWPSDDTEWDAEVTQDSVLISEFSKYGLIDALGSLHLEGDGQSGSARFFGPSGGSESLLLRAKAIVAESSPSSAGSQEVDTSYLPSEINIFYQAFPFTPSGIPTEPVQELIESYLPPLARATSLCEIFLKSLSWMTNIVSRQQVLGELIPSIYQYVGTRNVQPRTYGPHHLALLVVILAIGALLDPSLPAYNTEGQHYHRLARAALCLQSVFVKRSVVTIKVLHLMSIFNGMCGIEGNLENSYSLLNLAGQVALQIGFHKDPSLWGFTGREAYERRTYFWNLLAGSLWQSLVTGRPPAIMPSFIDCRIPTEHEEETYQSGEAPLGFGTWSFRYNIECLAPVVQVTQAAKSPSYQAVLELDRKIREFAVPHGPGRANSERMSSQMQSFARSHYRELTLLFLHRGFFAQALADFPSDPLRSPLSQSFLIAYQCASVLLNATREQFAQQPVLCARVWRIWSFGFSAAVIIGTVAIRRLGVKLDPDPFEQLEHACTLFHEAAQTSSRAQKALPILLRLRQKAVEARFETLQHGPVINTGKSGDSHSEPDELEVFGGRTLLVTPSKSLICAPTLDMRFSSAPSLASSSKPTQTLPPAVARPQLDSITEAHGEPREGALGLPLEWESLYREIPGPSHVGPYGGASAYPLHASQNGDENIMLEDRWSSFMHDPPAPSISGQPPRHSL